MPFSHQLRQAAADIWEAQHEHPFVRGIGDGTLDPERFRFYVRQDYLFLIEYGRLLALACARAPRLELLERFAELAQSTLRTEIAMRGVRAVGCCPVWPADERGKVGTKMTGRGKIEEPRDVAELAVDLAAQGVLGVAVSYVDNSRIARVKAVPVGRLEQAVGRGIGMSPVGTCDRGRTRHRPLSVSFADGGHAPQIIDRTGRAIAVPLSPDDGYWITVADPVDMIWTRRDGTTHHAPAGLFEPPRIL
jgi:hypothetical protein